MSSKAIDHVANLAGFTPTEKCLLLILAWRYNDDQGRAWPSQLSLAKQMEVTPRAVRNIAERCCAKGGLAVLHGLGRGNPNRYTFPGLKEEPAYPFSDQEKRNPRAGKEEPAYQKRGTPVPTNNKEQKDNNKHDAAAEEDFSGEKGDEDASSVSDVLSTQSVDLGTLLRSLGIVPGKIKTLRAEHGDDYLREKVTLTHQRMARGAVNNPSGFFLSAVKEDWKPETPCPTCGALPGDCDCADRESWRASAI